MSNSSLSHSILRDLTALISFGQPIPVAARSKAWVCGRSPAGTAGSNPARGGGGCLSLVSVLCCQAEVTATGRSLVQRSTIECGVSECDLEMSTTRRPRPTRAVEPKKKKHYLVTRANYETPDRPPVSSSPSDHTSLTIYVITHQISTKISFSGSTMKLQFLSHFFF